MADIIDNAKEKTKLLKEFLKSAEIIYSKLLTPEDDDQIEIISAEVEKRDGYISEINLINKLIESSNIDDGQKPEFEEQAKLWLRIMNEIQELEQKNNAIIDRLQNEYMGKVKSAKNSIRAIDAYSKLMTGAMPQSAAIDKRK